MTSSANSKESARLIPAATRRGVNMSSEGYSPRSARGVEALCGHSGGVEARRARTARESVLAGGDTDLRVLERGRGVLGRRVAVGSPTLVGMLFYGTASLRPLCV